MIYTFNIPKKYINTEIFIKETGFDLYIKNQDLIIAGELTEEIALSLLDAHNPLNPIEEANNEIMVKASRDAKLAKMGFTLAEIENW